MLGVLTGKIFPKKRKKKMAKRLGQPEKPIRVRLVVDDALLMQIEQLAAKCRLSVSSFARVVMTDAVAHPERAGDWKAIADKIAASVDPAKKPGRKKQPKE